MLMYYIRTHICTHTINTPVQSGRCFRYIKVLVSRIWVSLHNILEHSAYIVNSKQAPFIIMVLAPTVTLNNGVKMPAFGLGTYMVIDCVVFVTYSRVFRVCIIHFDDLIMIYAVAIIVYYYLHKMPTYWGVFILIIISCHINLI